MSGSPEPPTSIPCPCGSTMLLREGGFGRFWGCQRWPTCDYTVRARYDGSPDGEPVDRWTRRARVRAHAAFDALWIEHGKAARRRAYKWLAEQLEIAPADCHIAKMDREMCERVIALATNARQEL